MLLYIFIGFVLGFLASFRFVKRPARALVWGLLLGGIPLALMLGPGLAPIQGIGSLLNFAIFALGPLMLIIVIAIGAALGLAGGAAVLWVRDGRPSWVGWTAGLAIFGSVAAITLLPIVEQNMARKQAADALDADREEIIRADFSGTLAQTAIAFPATPVLSVAHDCADDAQNGSFGCSTNLTNPVTILTRAKDVMLNEQQGPIRFRALTIKAIEPDCTSGDYCLSQEKIDNWCRHIRPDKAVSIWCRPPPPMNFSFSLESHFQVASNTLHRSAPELAKRYAATPLGPAQITCYYHPDPSKTDQQGADCRLKFEMAHDIEAGLSASRKQITSEDPAIKATLDMIPRYWAALTARQ